VVLLEKLAYMGHDFADVEVALSRSFMLFGGRHLENRDYTGGRASAVGWYEIDGKRVKEGVIGCGWDVVFVIVECHFITELAGGEVGLRDSPGVDA